MLVLPGPADWERFWAALDAVRVWDWRDRYEGGAGVGPGWFVEVARAGRSVASSGLGAYPDGVGGLPGPRFLRVMGELSRLAGRRPFR